jgi:hypothetical protein
VKKVKFALEKNIVKWINNNVEKKLKLVESDNVEMVVIEALDDILKTIEQNLIEEKNAIHNVMEITVSKNAGDESKLFHVQATQCYKCKEFGHKKNVCSFIALPGVK